jgi:tetratricopeptide (TPR) repeat protein
VASAPARPAAPPGLPPIPYTPLGSGPIELPPPTSDVAAEELDSLIRAGATPFQPERTPEDPGSGSESEFTFVGAAPSGLAALRDEAPERAGEAFPELSCEAFPPVAQVAGLEPGPAPAPAPPAAGESRFELDIEDEMGTVCLPKVAFAPYAELSRASHLRRLGSYDEALECLALIPETSQDLTPRLLFERAICCERLRDLEAAQRIYERLDALDVPPYANLARGIMAFAREEDERALGCLEQALAESQFDIGEAHAWRALVLSALGDDPGALREVEWALNLEGPDPAHLERKGEILGNLEDNEGAIRAYTDAIRGGAVGATPYLERGSIYRKLGRLEEGLADFEIALQRDPEDPGAHCERARVLRDLGRHEEAEEAMRRASGLDPESIDYRQFLAFLYLQLGRPDEARQEARRLREACRENPKAERVYKKIMAAAGE